MADNLAVTPGSGATAAADDVGGILHQRVKLSLGADGSATDALGGTGTDSAGVQRVSLATNVALPTGTNILGRVRKVAFGYETVAASQTGQVLGGAGAAGDVLDSVVIIPASTSPGAVTIIDNVTSIVLFPGGATSVLELKPISIPLGIASSGAGWSITTGASVSVIAIGTFT